jgi:protein YIPF5/7
MWQDSAPYSASSSQNNYYGPGNQPNVPLQFYDQSSFYPGSRSSLEGNVAAQGPIVQPGTSGYTGNIQPAGGWWTAFGTGGFEGEPPLLEGACAVVILVRLSHHASTSSPQNSGLTSLT